MRVVFLQELDGAGGSQEGEKERNICPVDAFTCWKTHPMHKINKYIAKEPKMPKLGEEGVCCWG